MSGLRLALKVDVDTERGTRDGVPALARALGDAGVPACFFFSLGPDRTGRALRRLLRPGFLAKVRRTRVPSVYGLRTLGNGLLWPGPHIARRHAAVLRAVRRAGFGTGIHAWDHVRWQDGLARMAPAEVRAELARARAAYRDVFGVDADCAAAAGWQADARSLAAYDEAGLRFASDARGSAPFLPHVAGRTFHAIQIPTTLPTLDEWLGRPEHPEAGIAEALLARLRPGALEVMTLHAEIEGRSRLAWLRGFVARARAAGVRFVALHDEAAALEATRHRLPVHRLEDDRQDGRSGTLARQGRALAASGPHG